jgi:hypothetical protein
LLFYVIVSKKTEAPPSEIKPKAKNRKLIMERVALLPPNNILATATGG